MASDDNPLTNALPPAVDYLSYLTILEYNLTLEQLPLLHDILQDTTLTANIGWDLVHLLLPLLPESQSCLQDVARLGNPREVILKVTELLETLNASDGSTFEDDEGKENPPERIEGQERPDEEDSSPTVPKHVGESIAREGPSRVSQFIALLDMLVILHPRIKTRYPSRFLSTSLQAVLPAFATLALDTDAIDAVLRLIDSLAGTKRPRLPPRSSSTQVPTRAAQLPPAAPDPEATEESLAPGETALKEKLLQSFLTFVAEGYMSSLPVDDDTPALSWSTRLLEQLYPEKNIPGKRTIRKAFEEIEALHRRDSTIGQMLALTRDLNLTLGDLRRALDESDILANDESNDLPTSASEVSLSRPGCLYLLCASYASAVLFNAPSKESPETKNATFFSLLGDFLGDPSSSTLGSESLALIDSLLFFGHYTLQSNDLRSFLERPENDSGFTQTLQYFSIISANTPSAALRYVAHLLTSKILHAHPNDLMRLSFIKDTLQHCPYENLKASAVGWLKDEILMASPPGAPNTPNDSSTDETTEKTVPSIFATPTCIATLALHLFLSPANMDKDEFYAHESFFLATLNLYYLLLTREGLNEKLDLPGAGAQLEGSGADGGWLSLLDKGLRRFEDRGPQEERGTMESGMHTNLLEGMIAMCKDKET